MKITHDRESDVIRITFNDKPYVKGKMVNDNFILHVDENEQVIAVEILGASKQITEPNAFNYMDVTHPRFDKRQLEKEREAL